MQCDKKRLVYIHDLVTLRDLLKVIKWIDNHRPVNEICIAYKLFMVTVHKDYIYAFRFTGSLNSTPSSFNTFHIFNKYVYVVLWCCYTIHISIEWLYRINIYLIILQRKMHSRVSLECNGNCHEYGACNSTMVQWIQEMWEQDNVHIRCKLL